ncbi:MAG: hypothetical protein ABIR38_03025 [Chthoniobacterales bacterium]
MALILEPFLVARSVVHTVVDPAARHAPRAVATLATAPLRVARSLRDRDEAGPSVRRAVPFTETANYNQPFRVAYVVSRPPKPNIPEDEADSDEQEEAEPAPEISGPRPTIAGSRAILRGGTAYAPARAPQSVKNAIWAANALRGKPYIWGGGHGSFSDRGYDCSGTISYALRGAGAIIAPMPSSNLMRYGERGRGRWITIYARPGHTFAVIAGLRLDTTDFHNGGNVGPRWHAEMRETRGYVTRHPAGL